MTSSRRRKPFRTMRTSELAEATAAYGREMAIDDFGPMSKKARERWNCAQSPGTRAKNGASQFDRSETLGDGFARFRARG